MHLKELQQATNEHEMVEQVHFLPSFSDEEKVVLLQSARCVVYTPDKEHFGITPFVWLPTGQYSRNDPLSLGENRWR